MILTKQQIEECRQDRQVNALADSHLALWKQHLADGEWISVEDEMPDTKEPIAYRAPNPIEKGKWYVGIAYWTLLQTWVPDHFTHWTALPEYD